MAQNQLGFMYQFIPLGDSRRQAIRDKAYEIYKQHRAGDALEDWLEAEREVSMWWTCN